MATEEKPAAESVTEKSSTVLAVDKLGLSDILETELQCSICHEPFVMTTTLNCGHSFCATCIDTWMEEKSMCPVCRAAISSRTRAIAFDNYIERIIENLDEDTRTKRKQLVEQRKGEMDRRRERNGAIFRSPPWYADALPEVSFGVVPFGMGRHRQHPLFFNASDDEADDYLYSDDDDETASRSDSEYQGDSWFQQRFRESPVPFTGWSNSNADVGTSNDQPTTSSQQRRSNNSFTRRRASPFSRAHRDTIGNMNESSVNRSGGLFAPSRSTSWTSTSRSGGREWVSAHRGALHSRDRRSRGAHSNRGGQMRSGLRPAPTQIPQESVRDEASTSAASGSGQTSQARWGGVMQFDSWVPQPRGGAPISNAWNANASANFGDINLEAFQYFASGPRPYFGTSNPATHQSNWNAPTPNAGTGLGNSWQMRQAPTGSNSGNQRQSWGWNQNQHTQTQQVGQNWVSRAVGSRPNAQNYQESANFHPQSGWQNASLRPRFGGTPARGGRAHRGGGPGGYSANDSGSSGPSNFWWSRYNRWAEQRYTPPNNNSTNSGAPAGSGWPTSSSTGDGVISANAAGWTARVDLPGADGNNGGSLASRQQRSGRPAFDDYAGGASGSQPLDIEIWLDTHDYLPEEFDAGEWLSRHPEADPRVTQRILLLATARPVGVNRAHANESVARPSHGRNFAVYARGDAPHTQLANLDVRWPSTVGPPQSQLAANTAPAQPQAALEPSQTVSNTAVDPTSRLTDAMSWLTLEQQSAQAFATAPIGTGSVGMQSVPFFGQPSGFLPFGVGFLPVVDTISMPVGTEITPAFFVPPFADASAMPPFAAAVQNQPQAAAQNTHHPFAPQVVTTTRNG